MRGRDQTWALVRRKLGALFKNPINQRAVMRRYVFDVTHVLVAPLNLEAANPSIDQSSEIVALIVVFHRQQMLVERDNAALTIL